MRKFCGKARFPIILSDLPKTVRKFCLSTKFLHQEITWNYGIFCSVNITSSIIRLLFFGYLSLIFVSYVSCILTETKLSLVSKYSDFTFNISLLLWFQRRKTNEWNVTLCYVRVFISILPKGYITQLRLSHIVLSCLRG